MDKVWQFTRIKALIRSRFDQNSVENCINVIPGLIGTGSRRNSLKSKSLDVDTLRYLERIIVNVLEQGKQLFLLNVIYVI